MDIQVPMDKVLTITQEELAEASRKNIMLQAVVQGQQEELEALRAMVGHSGDTNDKEESNGSEG